eukprot:gene11174-11324_t
MLITCGFTLIERKGAGVGCSVIDYCLVSQKFLPSSISIFEVGEFVDALSDQAPLWCSFCLAPATSRAGAASATDRRPAIEWDNSESKREQYVAECEPQHMRLLEQLSTGVSLTIVADQWKMFWRVEWSFPSASAPEGAPAASGAAAAATGLTAVDGRVDEDNALCDVLQHHLDFKPGAGSQAVRLQQYRQVGCQGLTVLMKKERCPVSRPSLHLGKP